MITESTTSIERPVLKADLRLSTDYGGSKSLVLLSPTKFQWNLRSPTIKQRRSRLVLGWVIVREDRALWTCVHSSVWTFVCDRHRADTDVTWIKPNQHQDAAVGRICTCELRICELSGGWRLKCDSLVRILTSIERRRVRKFAIYYLNFPPMRTCSTRSTVAEYLYARIEQSVIRFG